MSSPACSSAALRRALFGLLLNDVCVLMLSYWLGRMKVLGLYIQKLIFVCMSLVVEPFLASLKSEVQRNKLATAGEAIEYRCLIRATDGKKTISTSVRILYILSLLFLTMPLIKTLSNEPMQFNNVYN